MALMSPVPGVGQDEPAVAEQVQVTDSRSVGMTSVTVAPVTADGPLLVTSTV